MSEFLLLILSMFHVKHGLVIKHSLAGIHCASEINDSILYLYSIFHFSCTQRFLIIGSSCKYSFRQKRILTKIIFFILYVIIIFYIFVLYFSIFFHSSIDVIASMNFVVFLSFMISFTFFFFILFLQVKADIFALFHCL